MPLDEYGDEPVVILSEAKDLMAIATGMLVGMALGPSLRFSAGVTPRETTEMTAHYDGTDLGQHC